MDQKSEKINSLLCYCFKNNTINYDLTNTPNFKYFFENELIKPIESENQKFILNFNSQLLNEELLRIIETEQNIELPAEIELALIYVDDFEKNIKVKFQNSDVNTILTSYKKNFKAFIINQFEYTEIKKHYGEILKNKKIDIKKRNDFIDAFFKYLEVYNFNEEYILSSCLEHYKSEKYPTNYIFNILGNIAKTNHLHARKLVDYIDYVENNKYQEFLPALLINLYNTNYNEAFDIAKNRFKSDPIIALKSLCGFNYTNSNQINQIYAELEQLEVKTVEYANLKSQLLCNFISNKNTDTTLRDFFFKEIVKLIKSDNHDFSNAVFYNVKYNLVDFEAEKYNLLNIYLNNTKNFNVLKDFFYEFKNPIFLFHLLTSNYDIAGFRGSIDIFKNAINHLYEVNREQFEVELLNLFSYRQYSLLALKIILSYDVISNNIDLNKLEEQAQINAIDGVCSFPHSINELIPMLLQLRNSALNDCKEHLKKKLAQLIFEVYHESLLDLIKNNLTKSKNDKLFLEPLQKSLDGYVAVRNLKKSIKDLDPRENERNLMELYYRLEHENQALMMKDINNDSNSFLSMTKTMIIVRGRAFKTEDSEEVNPLGLIESSIMIDNRAYKNPNNFEQNLENF